MHFEITLKRDNGDIIVQMAAKADEGMIWRTDPNEEIISEDRSFSLWGFTFAPQSHPWEGEVAHG